MNKYYQDLLTMSLKRFVFPEISCFIFMVITSITATGQEAGINQYNSAGEKTGLWEIYHDNGKLKSRGTFFEGHPVGEMIRYYPGGIIQSSMKFDSTGRQAFAKLYYENGKTAAEGKYIDQKKDSLWIYYSLYDGRKAMSEYYSSGKKDGPSFKYYPQEKPSEFIEWKNDLKNGKWEQYYENGQIRLTGWYRADTLNGEFISYNPDGSLSISGFYNRGLMDGKWDYFDETGNPDISAEYIMGKMLPNPEVEKRTEEFSKKIRDVIGNLDETELPEQ